MRTLRPILVTLALSLSACGLGTEGEDCTTPSDCEIGLFCFGGACTSAALECGEGTVELENGTCAPEPRDLACGTGTVERDGACVPVEEEDDGE